MIGNERFTFQGKSTNMSVFDLWQALFSDLYEIRAKVAEYLVIRALGIGQPTNTGYWSAQYIEYKGNRIELRQVCISSTDKGNQIRHVDVRSREGDLYVISVHDGTKDCLLDLDKWRFYVIPVWYIDSECGSRKTITLTKIRRLVKESSVNEIKEAVDKLLDDSSRS